MEDAVMLCREQHRRIEVLLAPFDMCGVDVEPPMLRCFLSRQKSQHATTGASEIENAPQCDRPVFDFVQDTKHLRHIILAFRPRFDLPQKLIPRQG